MKIRKDFKPLRLIAGNGYRSNLGFEFELAINEDLKSLVVGSQDLRFPNLSFDIYNKLGMNKNSTIELVGSKNTKPRGFFLEKDKLFVGGKAKEVVPDIMVDGQGVSLKFGQNCKYVNISLAKADLKLLNKHLGINTRSFNNTFRKYDPEKKKIGKKRVDKNPNCNKPLIQEFLRSVFGQDYLIAHQIGVKNHKALWVDKNIKRKLSTIKDYIITYPNGTSKQIDIILLTSYDLTPLKITIRNKNGGIYPDVLTVDYTNYSLYEKYKNY